MWAAKIDSPTRQPLGSGCTPVPTAYGPTRFVFGASLACTGCSLEIRVFRGLLNIVALLCGGRDAATSAQRGRALRIRRDYV